MFATYTGKHGTAHSENGYFAEGKHKAAGFNSTYAGVVKKHDKKHGSHGPRRCVKQVHSVKYFAGGHSSAWAF